MSIQYKKVSLASLEEFESFCTNNPDIKYIDAILSDISGIIRGKRLPINEAKKLNVKILYEKDWNKIIN